MNEYKRLTERVGKGIAIKETSKNDNKSIWNALERLAELEDKIENGTLIELPCKVGDSVYVIQGFDGKIEYCESYTVTEIYISEYNFLCIHITNDLLFTRNMYVEDFGKVIFLTKAEAEAKLKELKEV